jgi:predicted nucleotidyltransferase
MIDFWFHRKHLLSATGIFGMKPLNIARERYAALLENDLKNLTEQLKRIPEVQKVILFGSAAAGRRDLLTDIDLLVVMESDLNFVERCANLARRLHASTALDLLVYTPDEIEQMADRPFFRQALKERKILYEREPPK